MISLLDTTLNDLEHLILAKLIFILGYLKFSDIILLFFCDIWCSKLIITYTLGASFQDVLSAHMYSKRLLFHPILAYKACVL